LRPAPFRSGLLLSCPLFPLDCFSLLNHHFSLLSNSLCSRTLELSNSLSALCSLLSLSLSLSLLDPYTVESISCSPITSRYCITYLSWIIHLSLLKYPSVQIVDSHIQTPLSWVFSSSVYVIRSICTLTKTPTCTHTLSLSLLSLSRTHVNLLSIPAVRVGAGASGSQRRQATGAGVQR
jgi:hypothetical protein